jgi:hypothetical protein
MKVEAPNGFERLRRTIHSFSLAEAPGYEIDEKSLLVEVTV